VDRADRLYDADPNVSQKRCELHRQLAELTAAKGELSDELKESIASLKSQLAALPEQSRVYAAASEFEGEGQFTATG
jgi:hypothetical protein